MKWVTFESRTQPGRQVLLGGSFNGWKPSRFHQLRDRRRDGTYRTLINLLPGRHEYDFLVDGVWQMDPFSSTHVNAKVVDLA